MKNKISPRLLFSLGFVLLIAANIVVIYHVSTNRTGPYETMLELTERELALPYRIHDENSGIYLRLKWCALAQFDNDYASYEYHYQSPSWMDQDKLASLGFEMGKTSGKTNLHKRIVPRQAYIVLEYDGPSYREALNHSEKRFKSAREAHQSNPGNEKLRQDFINAETWFKGDQTTTSRLFAVDAGLNAGELRKKYPDRSRFIIAPGLVEMNWNYENKITKPTGYVSRLLVENIHVPLEFRRPFEDILSRKMPGEKHIPRYAVGLAYGSRFEPWIMAVHPIN